MLILITLLISILTVPTLAMLVNYQQETKIKKVTTQTILKKIKTGCVGENTDTLLAVVQKKDPTNHALQAYVVGKTWHTMRQYKHYCYDQIIEQFIKIENEAFQANNVEGKEVAKVMEYYVFSCQNNPCGTGKNPIEIAIQLKCPLALSYLISVHEPLYSSQLMLACENKDIESAKILVTSGCPTYHNNKQVFEQPLACAAQHAAEEDDFQLLKMLVPHANLHATFKSYYAKEVTVADYLRDKWQDAPIRVPSSKEAPLHSHIINLLTPTR